MNVSHKGRGYYTEEPNICPHCHVTNNPHHKWGEITTNSEGEWIYLSAWKCSNAKCNKLFIALHEEDEFSFTFIRFLNGLPKGPDWPKPILDLKSTKANEEGELLPSRFITTYLQSLEAENYGLDELAGMGYRKSIEYLVKDWAIQQYPEKKDDIEKAWLGQTIKEYYKGDLKEILERATWLGNDQAHYNKLFEEYDIDILKELIGLIMVELDRQYKKDHYIKSIQKRK